MGIIAGIICIFLGIAMIAYPITFLYMRDFFRIEGERTYTEDAIVGTRIGGGILIMAGLILVFSGS